MASVGYALAPVNGATGPMLAEDAELDIQLLQLRDLVLAGKHDTFKLPSAAIDRLKASIRVIDGAAQSVQPPLVNSTVNGTSFPTNHTQPSKPSAPFAFSGLPGLQNPLPHINGSTQPQATKSLTGAGLDPIFLEKSDSLVRAEGQLKRQRLERDLQAQVEQRKHSSRDKESAVDGPSSIDVDLVLRTALERVKPISGLQETDKESDGSSFDENDYYSSQVQSDWSSEAAESRTASDRAVGAFTADFERFDDTKAVSASSARRASLRQDVATPGSSHTQVLKDRADVYTNVPGNVREVLEEDDDYTPPDAAAFDTYHEAETSRFMGQSTPPEDENSDYEPGEITDNNVPTPQDYSQQYLHPAPDVSYAREYPAHIEAPQPYRVSPLATAKGPSIELELVNGRPEVAQRQQPLTKQFHSRVSTASPQPNRISGRKKGKNQSKKRKRDAEPAGHHKQRRRDKQAVAQPRAAPVPEEPYIKDEPVSPPPFANVPELPQYNLAHASQQPIEIDLSSPRHLPYDPYNPGYHTPQPRYEAGPLAAPAYSRMASPAPNRMLQRDPQDLRRIASLNYAQQPVNVHHPRVYSPIGPYAAASRTNGDPRAVQSASVLHEPVNGSHAQAALPNAHYIRSDRSRSPPRAQISRASFHPNEPNPSIMMPPPAAPARKVIVDADGNRYYAAEAIPDQLPRASMVPPESWTQTQPSYERAVSYAPAPHSHLQTPRYASHQMADASMPPPALANMKPSMPPQRAESVDSRHYRPAEYAIQTPQQYAQPAATPTSPVYQQMPGYEQSPAIQWQSQPQYMAAQPTSPVYAPVRSFSVRPEEPPQVLRHASVAPVQYIQRDVASASRNGSGNAQIRAVSVMPGSEYGAMGAPQQQVQYQPYQPYQQYQQQQLQYAQPAPTQAQGVRYVDQNGNEVFPREVRPVGDYRQ